MWTISKEVLSGLSTLLSFVANIHVARHVDIDGFYAQTADPEDAVLYVRAVQNARILARTLEVVVQAIYDDAAILLLKTQRVRCAMGRSPLKDIDAHYEYLDFIATSLKSNLQFLLQTLDALLTLGHNQADFAQGDYQGAIDWRMSHLSFMDSHFGARPMSMVNPSDPESEDIVDIEVALSGSTAKALSDRIPTLRCQSQLSDTTITLTDRTYQDSRSVYEPSVSAHTLLAPEGERGTDSLDLGDSCECFYFGLLLCSNTGQLQHRELFLMHKRSKRFLVKTPQNILPTLSHGTFSLIIPKKRWSSTSTEVSGVERCQHWLNDSLRTKREVRPSVMEIALS